MITVRQSTEKSCNNDPGLNRPNRITEETLREICKKNNLYRTPHLNDVLYLHFKGFTKIENLELYTGLKALWLENNCISEICGLGNQTLLSSLYLHNNMIRKIENLENLTKLSTINLCHNFIAKIENLSVLPMLSTLQMTHNKLTNTDDIAQLADCDELTVVDLSHNYLCEPECVEIFGKMKSLRVLALTGNPVISQIKNYRKAMILACNELHFLDERPVTERDRLCAEAWSTGGLEAEQKMRTRLINEEHARMTESVNGLMSLRRRSRAEATSGQSPDDDQSTAAEHDVVTCDRRLQRIDDADQSSDDGHDLAIHGERDHGDGGDMMKDREDLSADCSSSLDSFVSIDCDDDQHSFASIDCDDDQHSFASIDSFASRPLPTEEPAKRSDNKWSCCIL